MLCPWEQPSTNCPDCVRNLLVTWSYSHLQDPQRNRVYQWQGVELETGLTQLSFPLTSDPIQGSYKIVVQKNFIAHVEHSFSVEEYGKERRYGLQAGLTKYLLLWPPWDLGFFRNDMEKTRNLNTQAMEFRGADTEGCSFFVNDGFFVNPTPGSHF